MGDLASTDVTVTVDFSQDIQLHPGPAFGGLTAFAKLAFGDASKTYPTGGVPLPDPGFFNMNFPVPYKWVDIRQPVDGYLYVYDATVRANAPYGTIRIITISSGAEFTGAPAATTLNVAVLGK